MGSTLVAGLGGPLIVERVRRTTAHRDHIRDRRLDVYAGVLAATTSISENLTTWAARPLADLDDPARADLDRLLGELRVVGSDAIYEQFSAFSPLVDKFHRNLMLARHDQALVGRDVDDERSMRARMNLADLADAARECHAELEQLIRHEVRL
jgi:uncharacterized protein YceK